MTIIVLPGRLSVLTKEQIDKIKQKCTFLGKPVLTTKKDLAETINEAKVLGQLNIIVSDDIITGSSEINSIIRLCCSGGNSTRVCAIDKNLRIREVDFLWSSPDSNINHSKMSDNPPSNLGSGVKQDTGKSNPSLVFVGLRRALKEAMKVMDYGAKKYSPNGWMTVPNAYEKYNEAFFRHILEENRGDSVDAETGIMHEAHTACNALIRLELLLREREDKDAK